jgi:hypothetical protein
MERAFYRTAEWFAGRRRRSWWWRRGPDEHVLVGERRLREQRLERAGDVAAVDEQHRLPRALDLVIEFDAIDSRSLRRLVLLRYIRVSLFKATWLPRHAEPRLRYDALCGEVLAPKHGRL